MKKLILFLIFCILLYIKNSYSKETWILDKDLSKISFEVPVLLGKNVTGQFNSFEGLVEIDSIEGQNNKAIFSVKIRSIELNYINYKKLLLSETFFHEKKYPLALIDTNKFSYNNQNKIVLSVELNLKGKINYVPLEVEVIHLTKDLVQIIGDLKFSRTDFGIGINNWASTLILKDNVTIKTNLFLFRN